ncbi:hypothetical protein [Nitrosomonas oligotropha]|uniref:hypothetical protein n=1 Tax=Nitrosomonas oligotropha TaxID=42354 RepID=UPI000B7F24BD|nr:hypothetical protein [Nitrosomonas oligotropha]
MNLENGSRIALTSIDIEQKPGVTIVKDGDISGALGSQSVLLLSSSAGKKSTVTFNKGEVDMKHVRMMYSDNSSSLKAQYAQIKGDIRDAFFYFSERNSLSFSNLSFQVDLKCESVTAECDGVEWSSDGKVKLVGSISPFEANINGGSWALDSINTLRVTSGAIKAPLLKLDSTAAFFPISGRFNKFELQVDSQNFRLSSDSSVALASVKLRSNDINLSPDESYPSGSMSFDGSINSATFGNIDRVGVANASMSLSLSRKPADTVQIDDGTISASATVKDSANDDASASVNLSSIRASASELTADFSMALNSLGTTVRIPPEHKSEKEGGDLSSIEANINLHEVPIGVTLARPFIFSGKLTAKEGIVNIAPINGVPLALDISVPSQELVYINVNHRFPGGSENLCNPKVNLNGGVNRINGQADFALNNGSVSLNLRNFVLEGNISMSAEDRNCKYVAGLICGAIGSIAGPAGAISGAYLCASKVQAAEKQASEKINEAIHDTISSYKFTLGQ